MGWGAAIASLLLVTIIIAVYTLITGGMAAGALFRKGGARVIPAVSLIIATISLNIIEPLFSAPFCIAILGLNIYLEYNDTFGVLTSSIWHNQVAHFIFVYPPLVMLFTLTDIIVVSSIFGQFLSALVIIVCTGIGMYSVTAKQGINFFINTSRCWHIQCHGRAEG